MPRERIMIMAGGTGGHVYPALAVAEHLRAQGVELLWLGTERGMEAQLVPEHGYKLVKIDIGGLRGKGITQMLFAPFRLCRALMQALGVMRQFKPQAVLGMGGYASGPGGIAAWLSSIPLYIHEQNAIAGMTNRLLTPFARLKLEGFAGAFNTSKDVETTGNPVRQEILQLGEKVKKQKFEKGRPLCLLVLGGSQGARALNTMVPRALNKLPADIQLEVWHQTGSQHLQQTEHTYREVGYSHARVEAYITDMADAYSWADLVLCRAGALTLAELCVARLASILVPFPFAVDDHQTANARVFSDNGAAVLMPEPDMQMGKLESLITSLYQAPSRLHSMALKAGELAHPDATGRVAGICLGGSNA